MRSGNWSFSTALFKKQAIRFWPIWSLYTIGLFLMLPFALIMNTSNMQDAERIAQVAEYHTQGIAFTASPWVAMVVGLLGAMALWSYLYNHRAVSMIHALPLTRGSIFLTSYLSCIFLFMGPHLLIFLITLGVQASLGFVAIKALLYWLLCQSLLNLFFFSFATLIAFVTGHILVLPVLFAVFNFLSQVMVMMIDWVFSRLLFGYAGMGYLGDTGFLAALGKWLSPGYALIVALSAPNMVTIPGSDGSMVQSVQYGTTGMPVLWAYTLVGFALMAASYFLFRRRPLEQAGEVIAVKPLQPFFKYLLAFFVALVGGNLCYEAFQPYGSQNIVAMVGYFLLFLLIGYFLIEMLLHKSFRVFRTGIRGFAISVAVVLAGAVMLQTDVFGYESRVPDAGEVKAVAIQYQGNEYGSETQSAEEAAALIQMVTQLHQSVVSNRAALEGQEAQYETMPSPYYEGFSRSYVSLRYTLQDGSLLARQYEIPVTTELLDQAGSPAHLFDAIVNQPKLCMDAIFPPDIFKGQLILGEIDNLWFTKDSNNDSTQNNQRTGFHEEDLSAFLAAVQEDIEAGRLGRTFLLHDETWAKGEYANTIYFTFRGEYNEEEMNRFRYGYSTGYEDNTYTIDVNFPLQTTATSTLAFLAEHGIDESNFLITHHDIASGYQEYEIKPVYPEAAAIY